MKTFVYAVLLLIGLIVFKAFYWDSHHASTAETNATASDLNTSDPLPEPSTQSSVDNNNATGVAGELNYKTGWEDKSKRPVDQVGDTIAGKLKGKIETH